MASGVTRPRLLVAVALIVVLPASLWVIWHVRRALPPCPVDTAGERAYEDGAVPAHVLASGVLLGAAVWAGALRARWLALPVAYGALCALVPQAWLPTAFAGFLLAAQGVGLTLVGASALLLAYAVGHPAALHAGARRRDHGTLLTVLLVLAALGVQGELALVLTAAERACG